MYLTKKEISIKSRKSRYFVDMFITKNKIVPVGKEKRPNTARRCFVYDSSIVELIKIAEEIKKDKKDKKVEKEESEWDKIYKIAKDMGMQFSDSPKWELKFFIFETLGTTIKEFYELAPDNIRKRLKKLNLV